MTSQMQIEANRRNALASTGPRTEEGKAIVANNALKHGLTARRVLLPDETEEELAAFADGLSEQLQPVGEIEVLLAERVVAAAWRLRRVYRVEAGIFAKQFYTVLADRARQEAGTYKADSLAPLLMDEYTITDEAKYGDALRREKEATSQRDAEETALGAAFVRDAADANASGKLSRYEATIERSMYRSLRELERLQKARRGGDEPDA
jgi:hypothetical protein